MMSGNRFSENFETLGLPSSQKKDKQNTEELSICVEDTSIVEDEESQPMKFESLTPVGKKKDN